MIKNNKLCQQLMEPQKGRKLILFLLAVAFLCLQLFYSAQITAPSNASQVIPSDEPQLSVSPNGNAAITTTFIQVGKEYSAAACWLEPPWGRGGSRTEACLAVNTSHTNNSSFIYNTTATQLSCSDKPNHLEQSYKTNGVTIALLYFAKPAMLLRQIQTFQNYPLSIRQQLTILIVDDGSPKGLQAQEYINKTQIEHQHQLRLRLAHITTDKAWNIGGARNLAFYLADTPDVLLLDLDMLIPKETLLEALEWTTQNDTHILAHRFNRKIPDGTARKHPAVALIPKAAYWQSGGCDEDFCGNYGFTDVHFWWRWKKDTSRLLLDHMDTYIVEFNDAACNDSYISSIDDSLTQTCEQARLNLKKPVKKKEINKSKMKKKIGSGCWSNKFLRFRWVLRW